MQKKISSIPFSGTPEQEAKLKESIARHIDDPGAVMPVLQEAQEIYGYLPIEVQTMVAEGLGVSLEEVRALSEGQVQHLRMPRHSLLCKGLGRHSQQDFRGARYRR